MVSILGIGHCHPSTLIDNQFLEDLGIESSAEWILEKIGIETRCTCLPLDYIKETKNKNPLAGVELLEMTSTEMGMRAAEMAAERAGISISDIGMVISTCSTPTQIAPTESQKIACGFELKVPAYELYSACPGFALHMNHLNSMRPETLPDYVLCVATGAMTHKVNYSDRSDSSIWGDGAAAWIVSPRKEGRLKVRNTHFDANPLRSHAVIIPAWDHFHQEGRAVRDFSVRQTVRMIRALESNEENGIDWARDIFVGHQANGTMLRQIINNRKISETNHWTNVKYRGNQDAAGAPASISENWDKIETGQNVVVAVVGAGLSWGSVQLEAQ